jgi:hypothetical protein
VFGQCEMVLSTDEIQDDVQFGNTDRAHGQAVEKERRKQPEYLTDQCHSEYKFSYNLRTASPTMASSSSLPML